MYKEVGVMLGPMLTSQQIQVPEILCIYLEIKHRHSASPIWLWQCTFSIRTKTVAM